MSKKHFLTAAIVSILSLGIFSGAALSHQANHQEIHEEVQAYANGDAATYYEGISSSLSGESLRSALNSLNNARRQKTVGYKAMLNNPSQGFYVTDPGTGNNTITAFYSGKNNNGTSGLNREHMWPNSRGGSAVEADIHHTRPTLNAENGARGNSFYVEGKKSSNSGWDPAMESFGDETYRGDSARIIFYSSIASLGLTLVDLENDSTSHKTMGKLSDLLKWNLKYPVLERERVRNEGAQSLQGNRNPFIDHPEYACKIWGNYNDATKAICQGQIIDDEATLKCQGTPTKTTYEIGESFDPTGVTVIYNSGADGASDIDVTSQVTWDPATFTGSGSVEVFAKYKNLVASAGKVTVKAESFVTNPQVGVNYYLGFDNTAINQMLYINGSMASNNYALDTTGDLSSAAYVQLEQATGGYYLKTTKQGGSAKYIEAFVSEEYVDLRFSSTPITVWEYNSTYNTFTTEMSGCTDETKNGTCFPCSYQTYTDLRLSPISFAEQDSTYISHLYQTGDDPTGEKIVISGKLAKSSYEIADDFDPTGLYVTYVKNGVSSDVTSQATWTPTTFTTAGEIDIYAHYNNLSAYYGTVTVKEAEYIKISGTLAKDTYYVGDWIDPTGLTVTYYVGDVGSDVTNKVTWDPMQFDSIGIYELKAIYKGLEDIYGTVECIEKGYEDSSSSDTSSSESSSPDISSSDGSSSSGSSSSGGKGGGGCSASVGGSSSIIFISGFVALFFIIRKMIRIRKEDK